MESSCLLLQRDTPDYLASKSQHYTALEGLVLDLQVLSVDCRELAGSLSGIESSLRELEAWVSELQLVSSAKAERV